MPETLAQWDERYRTAAQSGSSEPGEPANIVTELLPLLPHGIALDVACGTGRNALFLAEHGWRVVAVDGSRVALDRLADVARHRNVSVAKLQSIADRPSGGEAGIDLVQADLERARLPANRFDLIVCVLYLQRTLFPQFVEALRPGGMLLMETFTTAQQHFCGGPKNPAYLLKRGELRRAFPALETVFSRELRAGQGIASLLAQKPQ